ncbi:MAG: phasin family protein [Alphaproteobacteria bacterium]|nr:phasin family protein [Alphaproteobacteria bacterium]
MVASTNEKSAEGDFKGFKMPNIDMNALMDSYKKNLEILGLINKTSVEVFNGIAKLQTAFVKQMISDMGGVVEKSTKPTEAIAEFSKVARDSAVRAIGNGKQIGDLLTMASNDITTATAKRIKESIEETKAAVNGKK